MGGVTVLAERQKTGNGGSKWKYRCKCGAEGWAWSETLKKSTDYCCIKCRKELASIKARARRGRFDDPKHWHGGCPERKCYKAWVQAKQRVFNPKGPSWHRYGGRGITMCSGMRHSYDTFLQTVGLPPFPSWSLGRIDNDGHYSCGACDDCKAHGWQNNVRWENLFDQNNNKSTTKMFTFKGRTQSLTAWAVETGISPVTLMHRIRSGMTEEQLFFTNNANRSTILFHSWNL